MRLLQSLYWSLLHWFDLAERRCMTCKRLLGFKYQIRPRMIRAITHGLCKPCTFGFESQL